MEDVSDYTQLREYKIAKLLWKIIPPIYLVFGTLGNLLTIVVLMQRRCRNSSIAMYLTALAVSDLLVLWTGLLRQWIIYMFHVDIRVLSTTGCKLHVHLVYVGFQCSSWFLVAVTCERFLSVCFPYKVRSVCKPRNAGKVIFVIVLFFVALNHHWFYSVTIQSSYVFKFNQTYKLICGEINKQTYLNFFEIWKWLDLFFVSLLPLTLLCVFNGSIICHVLYRKYKANHHIVEVNDSPILRSKKVSQLTITLITVSIVFILCSTPMSVYLIGQSVWEHSVETSQEYAAIRLWWTLVNILAYLNTSLNFVLYFLSGPKFRQYVKEFFRGEHFNEHHDAVLREEEL